MLGRLFAALLAVGSAGVANAAVVPIGYQFLFEYQSARLFAPDSTDAFDVGAPGTPAMVQIADASVTAFANHALNIDSDSISILQSGFASIQLPPTDAGTWLAEWSTLYKFAYAFELTTAETWEFAGSYTTLDVGQPPQGASLTGGYSLWNFETFERVWTPAVAADGTFTELLALPAGQYFFDGGGGYSDLSLATPLGASFEVSGSWSLNFRVVPEPTGVLLLLGAGGLLIRRR